MPVLRILILALLLVAGCAAPQKSIHYTTPKLEYERHAPRPAIYSNDPLLRVPPHPEK